MSVKTMSESAKLLPCPFCGGKAKIHAAVVETEKGDVIYSGKAGIHCTECHVETRLYKNAKEAAQKWNRRIS